MKWIKKVINDSVNSGYSKMKFKKKLLIYLKRKESSYFWSFIDILACKLDKIARIYDKKSIGDEYREEYKIVGISKNNKVKA